MYAVSAHRVSRRTYFCTWRQWFFQTAKSAETKRKLPNKKLLQIGVAPREPFLAPLSLRSSGNSSRRAFFSRAEKGTAGEQKKIIQKWLRRESRSSPRFHFVQAGTCHGVPFSAELKKAQQANRKNHTEMVAPRKPFLAPLSLRSSGNSSRRAFFSRAEKGTAGEQKKLYRKCRAAKAVPRPAFTSFKRELVTVCLFQQS